MTCLLACISKSVLATYGGFCGSGSHIVCLRVDCIRFSEVAKISLVSELEDVQSCILFIDNNDEVCDLNEYGKLTER